MEIYIPITDQNITKNIGLSRTINVVHDSHFCWARNLARSYDKIFRKFDKIIKSLDLNRHLWSHAWTKYESLPARKKSGRFKQLMKFVSKQYKGNLLLSERKMSESPK